MMGQAKARHPEFPGRFFNVGFVLNPDGEIIFGITKSCRCCQSSTR